MRFNGESIIKSTGTIGSATALSRVLGFLRDIIIANFFGTGISAQAFVVAFRIPNLLRHLVGEGAVNAAFVPVLSRTAEKDRDNFRRLSASLFTLMITVVGIATALGIAYAPFLVRIIAPGFAQNGGDKLLLTIRLTRFLFPYIFLVSMAAYSMGILHSLGHFTSPAFSSCMLNLSIIISGGVLSLCPHFGIWAIAWGVIIGGTLQFAVQVPFLIKTGWKPKIAIDVSSPALKKIGRLLVPRAFGAAVYQINILIDTILASFASIVGAGGVAALYYSNRLIQLPMAIFAIALSTAMLPLLSRYSADNKKRHIENSLSAALRAISFVMLPAAIGLIALGEPIIKILFERGEFTAYSTNITYSALLFYSFGLLAFAGIKILTTAYYSMQDTLTPVKISALSLVVNAALSILLMYPLKIGGLALATSASSVLCLFLLLGNLKKKRIVLNTGILVASIRNTLASCSFMLVFLLLCRNLILAALAKGGIFPGALSLLGAIGISIFIYLTSSYVINKKELSEIRQWLTRK
jgi:putative peptidoglycan lipid II flippase